jgi:hypothetical protein
MGKDDLFKKRKAIRTAQLRRKEAMRTGKETVLIICEGEKTEPNYFKALLRYLSLDNRLRLGEILVDDRKSGLDPSRLAEYAKKLFFDKRDQGITYDRVYCVFDRDCHTRYAAACKEIDGQPLTEKRAGKIRRLAEMTAITSLPCFEVWLLFHFVQSSAPFSASGKRTPCERVVDKLVEYPGFEHYRKGDGKAFENTRDKLETAMKNAERIWNQKAANGDNPSTRVFELVAYLKQQASE